MKKIIIGIVALAFVAGVWWQWGGAKTPQSNRPPAAALEVEAITIQPQSVTIKRTLSGRTSAYRTAEIRPQVNGIIRKRLFVEGSHVKEGQLLFEIDAALYQAAYDKAKADLLYAQTSLATALTKAARFAELVKVGGISRQEFDDIKAQEAQGEAQVAVAEAALESAKINLNYTKIVAPISGHIGKALMTEGSLVTANQPGPLAVVQQLDPIYVDVAQPSSDLLKLRSLSHRTKQKALLINDRGSSAKDQVGDLQFCDVSLDPTTGMGSLRILFPNPHMELLPGLFVRVQIDQAKEEEAILVPHRAITRHPNQSVTVWVIQEGNKVASQPIQVSELVGENWLVADGLNGGERVVVSGLQKIQPNMVVVPIENKR